MSVTIAQSTATITIAANGSEVTIPSTTPAVEIYAGQQRYWGAFADYTTQTIASSTAAYAMTLNTTEIANGVSVQSSSRITFANAGIYNLQWSGQFQNTDNQLQDVSVWIKINGADVTGSTGFISIPNAHGGDNGHTIAGWNYFLNLNANDYVQFYWRATNTAVSLKYYAAQTGPTRPSTASLIVTAQMV